MRFVVCTLNLWADARWPERQESLAQFINYHRPDILALQELRPATRDLLDTLLPGHRRVDDSFAGWHEEGNLYWSQTLFELVEYGMEPIGQLEELRRLFWVRVRPTPKSAGALQERSSETSKRQKGQTLLISTAHYTWPGHPRETADAVNPRVEQAQRTVAALDRLAGAGEPLLFMGDLNDLHHPLRVLREGGLQDSFTALGRNSPITRPSLMKRHEPAPQVTDWILHRGPLRPMACDVVDFFANDLPPSDHKPVLVTYALEEPLL